jgi:hypothetical protein
VIRSIENGGNDNRYWHHNPGDATFNTFIASASTARQNNFAWGSLAGFNATYAEDDGVVLTESQMRALLDSNGIHLHPVPETFVTIAEPGASPHDDEGLHPGTVYEYRIAAVGPRRAVGRGRM